MNEPLIERGPAGRRFCEPHRVRETAKPEEKAASAARLGPLPRPAPA